MNQTKILVAQGIAITLQIMNSGLHGVLPDTRVSGFVILSVAAAVGGFQFIVQHLGNASSPNGLPKPEVPKPELQKWTTKP